MNPQNLPSYFLPLLLVLASFSPSFSTSNDNFVSSNVTDLTHSHIYISDIATNKEGKRPSFSIPFYEGKFLTRLSQGKAAKKSTRTVNVDDFGAKADGTDDSEAFRKAWEEACSSKQSAIMVVSKHKTYHLKPITFSGPCKSDIIVKIFGTIEASTNENDYSKDREHWLVFNDITNLRVQGRGIINGNGKIWWKKSCKINKNLPCKVAPTAITFEDCKNVIVSNLKIRNAQQMHLTFSNCVNVRALKLVVTSPGKSPNTDGIHVTGTKNIRIRNSVIRTGDDCISIVSGSKNVVATDIVCGPGHGISIGSLGAGNSEAEVSNVFVNNATLSGTTNGVRIKTWQGGSGYAKNIVFQNVVMRNVTNPIIIDQNYCDRNEACPEQTSAVQVSNVVYRSIQGTSASEVTTKFDCSKTHPCQGILLQNVNLAVENGGSAQADCDNVNYTNEGKVAPKCSN